MLYPNFLFWNFGYSLFLVDKYHNIVRFLGEIYAGNVVNLLYNLSQGSQVSSTHFHSITSIQFTDFKWKWEGFLLLPLFLLLSQFPLNSLNMFPLRRLHFKQVFIVTAHFSWALYVMSPPTKLHWLRCPYRSVPTNRKPSKPSFSMPIDFFLVHKY